MYLVFAGNTPPIGGIDDLKYSSHDVDEAKADLDKLIKSAKYEWAHLAKVEPLHGYQVIGSYERGLS